MHLTQSHLSPFRAAIEMFMMHNEYIQIRRASLFSKKKNCDYALKGSNFDLISEIKTEA
jgi:hypothetical protein